jgi:hypothetical protein
MWNIEDYASKQDIYFACKALNYRARPNKWDGNRPLSVYIDWKLEEGKLKAEFIMDRPLEKKGDEIGLNIQRILKELKIVSTNFNDLKDYLDTSIIVKN